MRRRADTLSAPNLSDYEEARQDFSWPAAQQLLSGLPDGAGLNIAYEAVDRHVLTGRGRHVLVIDAVGEPPDGTLDLQAALAAQPDAWTIPPTSPEAMALLDFTSGTTGTPKGAIHVHEAVVAHHITSAFALDLRPDDVFWCTADPRLGDRNVVRHHRSPHPRRHVAG